MNLFELFTELMDQIYYDGYVNHLISFDPDKLNFEFNLFLSNY